ncbi:MAG: penicillin-binding transpeptidase domain-containing protein, partial [Myxococcota bacterium]|nr:penicillin-binding transpeptidase domain-containing protein [Myxococcota bacterium]
EEQKQLHQDPQRAVKNRILEIYLNEVYLGQANGRAIVGVEEAARVYFSKPLSKLTLSQSATLAGIISAPNTYSPIRHPQRAKKRRDLVLMRMEKMGWLSKIKKKEHQQEELIVQFSPKTKAAPWFVDHVSSLLRKNDSQEEKIVTSLDPVLQTIAERVVKENFASLKQEYTKIKDAQIALIAVRNRDGAVVAMVGGENYKTSQFNRALYAKRQIGSVVKPLLATASFDLLPNWSPGCWIEDKELLLLNKGVQWRPQNYDRQFRGAVTLREAMSTSRNIPFVNIFQTLSQDQGASWFEEEMRKLDLDASKYPSSSLGSFTATPLDMARVYTLFANGGSWVDPWFVSSSAVTQHRFASEAATGLSVDMMRSVMESGTGRKSSEYAPGAVLYGKSGTSDQARDAWFVGFDREYSVAVWVGFDRESSLGIGGSVAALPIWARFMDEIGAGVQSIPVPKSIKSQLFCADAPDCIEQRADWVKKTSQLNKRCTLGQSDIFNKPQQGFWSRLFSF